MKKNEISPLDELRQEKIIIKREVAKYEERLAERWLYISDNAVSLLINSAVNGIAAKLGFGHRIESRERKGNISANGIMQNVMGGLTSYYPLIWEIVQPMLFTYAVKKVKSIFTRKKKKRKDDDD